MANYRPKSLSELNNVYDKAMRAEKAIKESSTLLSIPENETTPPSENIFLQLENKAAEAEKNQVFDPDITNIANDFLKRYAQPQKVKAPPQEVKRPAPSIQSVYHAPAKPKQEQPQDVPLNLGNDFASGFEAPRVPLHKPAPTMPVAQPEIAKPEPVKEEPAPEVPETAYDSAPAIIEEPPVVSAPAVSTPAPEKKTPVAPVRHAAHRVRITSTERSELMEEYMRVMYDEDDDDDYSYKKPKFSFFKKKKKYEEEIDEDPANLYEELPEEEYSAEEEIPVVPFDDSDVKYTDEYSDAPAEAEEEILSQEPMNLLDYIEADFDYEESDEDSTLDISLANTVSEEPEEVEAQEETAETEIPEEIVEIPAKEIEAEEVIEEVIDETEEEIIEEIIDETEEEIIEVVPEEEPEEIVPAEEVDDEEAVVYPTEESEEDYPDAPPSDMVFEDIFSVTDESKRSHTGGNWEEVFGKDFVAADSDGTEDYTAEEVSEYSEADNEVYNQGSYEKYPEYNEEEEYYPEETPTESKGKNKGLTLKILMVLASVLFIAGAASTVILSSVVGINSGKLISDRYRVYSVSENLGDLGLSSGDLIITENTYVNIDSLYAYVDESTGTYTFGKVIANTSNDLGDYLYETQTKDGVSLVNRDNSMGVVIATYGTIGSIVAAVCDYYIFIAGALLILAVAMIVCFVLISKKSASSKEITEVYEEDNADDSDSDADYDDGDEDYEDSDNDGDYYSDFDTDGIEQGLFSDI